LRALNATAAESVRYGGDVGKGLDAAGVRRAGESAQMLRQPSRRKKEHRVARVEETTRTRREIGDHDARLQKSIFTQLPQIRFKIRTLLKMQRELGQSLQHIRLHRIVRPERPLHCVDRIPRRFHAEELVSAAWRGPPLRDSSRRRHTNS